MGKALTIREMKKEAARRLFDDRRAGGAIRRQTRRDAGGAARRRKGPELSAEELREARLWHRMIARVEQRLQAEDPTLHRFMIRYFALKAPLNRRRSEVLRHMELAEEFHVSVSTLYKWRMEVVNLLCLEAMARDAVRIK